MGAVKNAFHDEIIWTSLDEFERQDAIYFASGMSAGTAETQSGSGLQPASPTAESGDAQDMPASPFKSEGN